MSRESFEQIRFYCDRHGAALVAVSKTKSVQEIHAVYEYGQKIFGENKVQELVSKQKSLPEDIHWHLIGHLQTNKVKAIVSFVSLIQSIDSLKLLTEINKRANEIGRVIPVLLQIHIAQEETKFGLSFDECAALLLDKMLASLENIIIHGFMAIATFTNDENQIRKEFRDLKNFFDDCRKTQDSRNVSLQTLSMGMSNDYRIAIEEGSNMVRIGSAIFGERN